MSVIKPSSFLYSTLLGGIAKVHITQNNTFDDDSVYAGNLALHIHDEPSIVLQRRIALEKSVGLPIQWLDQVHGNTVYTVSSVQSIQQSPSPIADAAMTQDPSVALAVMTADCLPVIFSAHNLEGTRAIAVAHAGWRGLKNGILDCTLSVLHQAVSNAVINVHLAPCIGVAQFEVGDEVQAAFVSQSPEYALAFTAKSKYKYLCDLNYLAKKILNRAGVSAKNINGGGFCTVSDPRLSSYRRHPITGRFASIVSMIK
jgi:polyphenol oxidase